MQGLMIKQAGHHLGKAPRIPCPGIDLGRHPRCQLEQAPPRLRIRRRMQVTLEPDRRQNLSVGVDGVGLPAHAGTRGTQHAIEAEQGIFLQTQESTQVQSLVDTHAGQLKGQQCRMLDLDSRRGITPRDRLGHRVAQQFGTSQCFLCGRQGFAANQLGRSGSDDAHAIGRNQRVILEASALVERRDPAAKGVVQRRIIGPCQQAEGQSAVLRFIDYQFDPMRRVILQESEHPVHRLEVAQHVVGEIAPRFVTDYPEHRHPGDDQQHHRQPCDQQTRPQFLSGNTHSLRLMLYTFPAQGTSRRPSNAHSQALAWI